MSDKRGRLSSLDLLPSEAQEDVDWAFDQLRARKQTQDDIRDQFNLRLRMKGIDPVSASAFNRAAVRTARMANRLGEVGQIAAALAAKNEDQGNNHLTLLISDALKTIIFEMTENAGQLKATPLMAEMVANMASALKSLEGAKKISIDTSVLAKKNFSKAIDAAIDKVGAFKGVSPEAKEAFKRELFGIRGDPVPADG